MPDMKIKSAASYPNGIAIRSVTYPKLSVKIFWDLKENTRRAVLYSNQTMLYSPFPFKDSYFQIAQKVADVICLFLILLLLFLKQFGYAVFTLTFALFLSKSLSEFITDVFILNFTEDGKRNARFHAVEHKAINSFEKLQRVPTLSEIKKASRFTVKCGSLEAHLAPMSFATLYLLLILSNELFQDTLIKLFAMLLSACICGVLLEWGDIIFQYLEIFLTREPTEKELTVGVEAIKGYLLLEGILKGETPVEELDKFFDNVELIEEAHNGDDH